MKVCVYLLWLMMCCLTVVFTPDKLHAQSRPKAGVKTKITPTAIAAEKMKAIYEEVKTPYKYGLVVVPESNDKKLDCPTVFRKGNKWYMTYIIFDGRGYETWLAESSNLLDWKTQGKLLSFSDTTRWDGNQKAGYPALQDMQWGGDYSWPTYKGKYWMSYFGGNTTGYEAGDLSIGIAFTKLSPSNPHEWERLAEPVLTAKDADIRWWENRKLFKSSIIRDNRKLTGHEFVMYYNANGDSARNNIKTRWFERIGMAVSDDMVNWKRYNIDPVVHHPVGITGDGVIQKIGDVYVMFYFGAFWQDRKGGFNRFAVSTDLVNWTDWEGENLIESSAPYDEVFAHKSFVLKHNGVVYHYYCGVNKSEQRGIAVATSKDLGQSTVNFVAPAAVVKKK
ncbi:glycosylase [Pedobacter sp. AW31-3R]|uniref:glycosylase n=1 Tax=Pedobacter sp. AW31-3R TaxID=3445781 RepID=UPI003FA13A04